MRELLVAGLTPGSVSAWAAFLAVVAVFFRVLPRLREVQSDSDTSLRGDLLARIASLETQVHRLEDQIGQERDRHESEMQVLRHRLNNETASLDALLMLLEANPKRVTESLAAIKEMRATRAANIALERGAMAGARSAGKEGLAP